MLKMNKRGKDVNWSKFANASPKPKRLHLEEDDCDGLFHCPVQICNHEGFATQRGCRKHVKNKHSWYYYFDEKPDSAQIEKLNVDETSKCEASDQKITPRKSRTIASFDPKNKIAKNFFSWLTGSGGGCKSDRQAQQIVSKCLKFLKFCCEDEEEVTFDIVDFSLCSPNLLFKFVDTMQDDWNLGHAGRIGYLDAIAELVDYRKVNGASESVLRGLTSTEIYLKKVRKTVSKMMRLQWTSELDIDALEAKGHWATLEELLEVVGRYLPRYESVLKSCKEKPGAVLPIDLSFATKFVAVYLFIKVKGSRPMTYQYLTVEMVNKAKTNGGFVDQKMFKTAGKYGFDSLYLTETSMQVLDGYINHIRPLLRPTCDFVLVTRNGGQHQKLGGLMSKLVFDATGKYVHPTRYRQIVETASSRQLSSSAQSTISEDQKHSSVVARVHYQKQRSREVASKAHEYLERLHGDKGSELEIDVRSRLSGDSASFEDRNGSKTDTSSNDEGETIAETPPERLSGVPRLKRENAFIVSRFPARKKSLMFTPEEDNYLKAGIERYGYGQWKAILRDSEFRFQKGRTANSLLSRAARRFGSLS
ncbi:unnamed protein product [Porites lobata]|uniref:HTH myb-type domain-containing protein n=1 Tax=Porites lobata TaxID=104759 RepID=A0ABN8PJM1_9CNID|nr:unnamed protein product [Porites lobata]